jgi:hypothetical protein
MLIDGGYCLTETLIEIHVICLSPSEILPNHKAD